MDDEKLDRIVTAFICFGILCVSAIVLALLVAIAIHTKREQPADHSAYYAKTAIVTELNDREDIVVCEDYNGYIWEFQGVEDWCFGDCVSLVMDDNGTPSVLDDVIVSTRYSGWNLSR